MSAMPPLPNDVSFVKLPFNLAKDLRTSQLLNFLILEMQKHPDYSKYKLDIGFLGWVCDLVENLVDKKNMISKKDLVIKAFSQLFNLTPEDKVLIENNIEYLWNAKNIKKVTKLIPSYGNIAGWIFKKLL